MKVILENVRIAFPELFEPKSFGDGEPRCGANFIMEPGHKSIAAVQSAITQVAAEKWKDKAPALLKQLSAAGKLCLQNGDTKAQYGGFEGNFFVAAGNKARPIVVDSDKAPLTAADGKPYAGCYVHASIDVWAQDNDFGKRINAKLLAVRFVKDGEAFGGGTPGSVDDFDDIEVQEVQEVAEADLF